MTAARRVLEGLSRLAAMFGGFTLCAAAAFSVAAVIAAAWGAPVLGDSEIVELAAGVAVTCFMPLCQLNGGHVAITVFTDRAPAALRRILDTLAAAAFCAVVLVLVQRLGQGGIDAYQRGRISMFLQLPQWWGYAAVALPALLWAATAAFVLIERLAGVAPPPPEDAEA